MGRGANEAEGLSAFGRELVRDLQDWGIAVDVAHVNTPGVLDVCSEARAPVLCTHTGVKGVHDHPRNLSDDEIDAIAELRGVIGVMFSTSFWPGLESHEPVHRGTHRLHRAARRH